MEKNRVFLEDKNYFTTNVPSKSQPENYEQIVYLNKLEITKPQVKRRR